MTCTEYTEGHLRLASEAEISLKPHIYFLVESGTCTCEVNCLNVVIIRVKMVLQADDLIKLYKVALLFFADWHECCTSSQFTITTGVHQN